MPVFLFTFSIMVCAALTIIGHYLKKKKWVYVFKPLTTALIFSFAMTVGEFRLSGYPLLIAGGLMFSLAGDVYLMLPRNCFIQGLISFLIAHLFYTTAFFEIGSADFYYWPLIPLVLYGAVLFWLLSGSLGRLKIPVFIYMGVIVVMAWQAWETVLTIRTASAFRAGAGALLFMVSDSLLAWNRFRRPFKSAEAIKLGLYFTAQWLIAFSATL